MMANQTAELSNQMRELHDDMKRQREAAIDRFVEEACFAKVVRTARGDALMINGQIYDIDGPSSGISAAELISIALRRAVRGSGDAQAHPED